MASDILQWAKTRGRDIADRQWLHTFQKRSLSDEIARALIQAEARGAERMKERAAEVADEHAKAWGRAMGTGAIEIATAIRNLETKDAG